MARGQAGSGGLSWILSLVAPSMALPSPTMAIGQLAAPIGVVGVERHRQVLPKEVCGALEPFSLADPTPDGLAEWGGKGWGFRPGSGCRYKAILCRPGDKWSQRRAHNRWWQTFLQPPSLSWEVPQFPSRWLGAHKERDCSQQIWRNPAPMEAPPQLLLLPLFPLNIQPPSPIASLLVPEGRRAVAV